jgi:hypothetical protein
MGLVTAETDNLVAPFYRKAPLGSTATERYIRIVWCIFNTLKLTGKYALGEFDIGRMPQPATTYFIIPVTQVGGKRIQATNKTVGMEQTVTTGTKAADSHRGSIVRSGLVNIIIPTTHIRWGGCLSPVPFPASSAWKRIFKILVSSVKNPSRSIRTMTTQETVGVTASACGAGSRGIAGSVMVTGIEMATLTTGLVVCLIAVVRGNQAYMAALRAALFVTGGLG